MRKMSLKKDKCGFVIKHAIASYFENLHVRLPNSSDEKAKIRYLRSEFLVEQIVEQILSAFKTNVTQNFSGTEFITNRVR